MVVSNGNEKIIMMKIYKNTVYIFYTNCMIISNASFESLIVLSILIFIMIIFACFLSKITKGTFCCKEQIHNTDETFPL